MKIFLQVGSLVRDNVLVMKENKNNFTETCILIIQIKYIQDNTSIMMRE